MVGRLREPITHIYGRSHQASETETTLPTHRSWRYKWATDKTQVFLSRKTQSYICHKTNRYNMGAVPEGCGTWTHRLVWKSPRASLDSVNHLRMRASCTQVSYNKALRLFSVLNTPKCYISINGMKVDSILLLKNPPPTPFKSRSINNFRKIEEKAVRRRDRGTGVRVPRFSAFLPHPHPSKSDLRACKLFNRWNIIQFYSCFSHNDFLSVLFT